MSVGMADLLAKVKAAVLEAEPGAQIILYGSRARGDAGPDADWDLLVLLDGTVDAERIARTRRRVYEVERETGEVLSTIVESREAWNGPLLGSTPFHRTLEREGIIL